MENIEGLKAGFAKAKVVTLTTYGIDGEKHERPMVNINKNPYGSMDFTTYKNTRKVEDIRHNSEVSIKFPGGRRVNTSRSLGGPSLSRMLWFRRSGSSGTARCTLGLRRFSGFPALSTTQTGL